jgi:uncharacterized membrane protein
MQIPWMDLHGALTHFPIALLFTALAFEIGAMIFKKAEWRTVSFWMIVSAAVFAAPSVITGLEANTLLFGSHPPSLLPAHRLAGYVTLVMAILAAVLRAAQGKNADARAAVTSSMIFLIAAVGAAGYTGFLGGKMVFGGGPSAVPSAVASAASSGPIPAEPAELISLGQAAFASNSCISCHSIGGVGGHTGPDLTHESRRHPDVAWQIQHLKNPASTTPGSTMPPYDDLPASQLKALAAFLVTRS